MENDKEEDTPTRPPTLDFRPYTASGGETIVEFDDRLQFNDRPDGLMGTWFRAGLVDITSGRDGEWKLSARYAGRVTDFEHDSAYCFTVPLIGLRLIFVRGGRSFFEAYVHPRNEDEFRFPTEAEDPAGFRGARQCTHCDEPHTIVPEGRYQPPRNPKLYAEVAGCKLRIYVGPPTQEDEEEEGE